MFFELMTTWKIADLDNDDDDTSPAWSTYGGEHQKMLERWKLRRVGVLFSKQKGGPDNHDMWIFLVFFEPARLDDAQRGSSDNESDLVFPHAIVDTNTDSPNVYLESTGFAYCYDREDDIKDTIKYFLDKLADGGPKSLEQLADEIFWGWGTLLKDMRGKILSVSPHQNHLTADTQLYGRQNKAIHRSTLFHAFSLPA